MADKIARWRVDPARFVREAIGARPDRWQVYALEKLLTVRKVSVAACHGVGKDTVAAWAVLWVMTCFKHPKIPCTAPTSHQLYDLLWSEIAKWFAKMPTLFRSLFDLKAKRFERKTHRKTWFAAARTARKENSEALQGFHAEVVLVIVDEASGVDRVIFEVLEGALTGGDDEHEPLTMMLLISNPTQTTGAFYDSHHKDREHWCCIRVFAVEVHDGTPLAEGVFTSTRVGRVYVDDMMRYGEDSNVVRVRVKGLFPRSEADQTIPLEWLEAARSREPAEGWRPRHYVTMGLDVARYGSDDSALVARQGPRILRMGTWHGHAEHETAGKAVEVCKELALRGLLPLFLFVDENGIGKEVLDILAGHPWLAQAGVNVLGVNAGAASPDPECARMRDALWWRGRKFFNPRIGNEFGELPTFDPAIERELIERFTAEMSGPKYKYALGSSLLKVEGKDEMRARGLPSPDLADAYLLTLPIEAGMPEPPRRTGWRDHEGRDAATDWMEAA